MTARTSNFDEGIRDGNITSLPVLAAEILYQGTPLFVNSAGNVYSNDGTTNTLSNGDHFAGICKEKVDNSSGAAADLNVDVYQKGCFVMNFSDTLTKADVGKSVYVNDAQDDNAVTVTSSTGNPQATIGKIVEFISANRAWVTIDDQIMFTIANGA